MHSISTKMITETLREYSSISSFGRKHQASFYNVLVLHKLYKACVTHRRDENYIPGSQKFISFFPPKFHLNLLRCQCKNTKRFPNFRPPQLARQSPPLGIIWIRCNTLVAWQRLHVVLISCQKELYVHCCIESDEVRSWKRRKFSVHLTLFKL